MKTSHFPWERLATCLIADIAILAIGYVYKDWLWDFAVLDPAHTSGGVAITALSAFCGAMVMGIVAIQIYFITGSTRSLEAMFKFGAGNQAAENLAAQVVQEFTDRKPRPRDFEEESEDGKLPVR